MKILFICKNRNDTYGMSVGLVNSAKFVINSLIKIGYTAKLEMAVDANCIDRIVTEYNPQIVVIEALWVTPDKFKEILSIPIHADRKWIVRIHSKTPFLACEGMAFDWIIKYVMQCPKNLFVAPNSESLCSDLKNGLKLDRVIHLPNIYDACQGSANFDLSKGIKDVVFEKSRKTIDVGCFGAIRPMKNTLEQAISARIFADKINKKLRFHVNGDRVETRGEEALKNLRAVFSIGKHELVEHSWMDHGRFVDLVKTMDLGMQVSMSESFNIVAADFAANNIPIVVSHDMEWVCGLLKADVSSAEDMVDKLTVAWNMRNLGICYMNRKALDRYNKNALCSWKEFLG